MKAKKIEVIKKWPKRKSIQDIQVFLGFANFYWQFIQSFSRIAAPLTLILKIAAPPEKFIFLEVDDNIGGNGIGGVEIAKKSGKLKGQKLSKSQKLTKSKKLSKSRN